MLKLSFSKGGLASFCCAFVILKIIWLFSVFRVHPKRMRKMLNCRYLCKLRNPWRLQGEKFPTCDLIPSIYYIRVWLYNYIQVKRQANNSFEDWCILTTVQKKINAKKRKTKLKSLWKATPWQELLGKIISGIWKGLRRMLSLAFPNNTPKKGRQP